VKDIKITIQGAARATLTRFHKDDPDGIDQVLDSINTLKTNPEQGVKWGTYRRMHVGRYRVLFQIIDKDPVVVSIENVGRAS
jgi:mRNA-degrading endonuclease RelE of RelBE toxin-antitoxin system